MHKLNIAIFFIALLLLLLSTNVSAELAYIDPATNQSVLDQVVYKFWTKVKAWQNIIQGAA